MSNNNSSNTGIGFAGLLTIVFIALKLIGYINWSWIWVLCPIWIQLAFVLIVAVIILLLKLLR